MLGPTQSKYAPPQNKAFHAHSLPSRLAHQPQRLPPGVALGWHTHAPNRKVRRKVFRSWRTPPSGAGRFHSTGQSSKFYRPIRYARPQHLGCAATALIHSLPQPAGRKAPRTAQQQIKRCKDYGPQRLSQGVHISGGYITKEFQRDMGVLRPCPRDARGQRSSTSPCESGQLPAHMIRQWHTDEAAHRRLSRAKHSVTPRRWPSRTKRRLRSAS